MLRVVHTGEGAKQAAMTDRSESDELEAALALEANPGFQQAVGYRLTEWSDGRAVVEMEVSPAHLNRGGIVHGGVYATLLDAALGYCGVFTGSARTVRRALTLSLTVNFTGQIRAGLIRTVALRRSAGQRIFVATGECLAEDGTVLAIGQATFRHRSSQGES